MLLTFLSASVVGVLTGWMTGLLAKSSRKIIENMLIGIIGADVSVFILSLFSAGGFSGFNIYSLIEAFLGAAFATFIFRQSGKTQKSLLTNTIRSTVYQQPLQPLPPVAASVARATSVRVFVSHSHKDEAVTMRLVGDLQRAGASVWVDVADLQSGDFMQRINTALGATDWVILVQTPNSLASPAVAMEVNAAINMTWKNQVRGVIPFIVAPCDPATIPPTWSTLHYYDATRDYPAALQQLLRAVGLTH